jgi:phosphomannomutase/phosphoglucomutase
MAPFCPDDKKYQVVQNVTDKFMAMKQAGTKILGQDIMNVVTVNGVRVTLADGTWGLVRASSNKPSLVVVVESPANENQMYNMFELIDQTLQNFPEVGEYDQKIKRP